MTQKEKTYTRKEMDMMMKKHIEKNAEILRKNLEAKSQKSKNIIEHA